MNLEQRVEYLELRDKNTRMLIDTLSNLVDVLSESLELLILATESNREDSIETGSEGSR